MIHKEHFFHDDMLVRVASVARGLILFASEFISQCLVIQNNLVQNIGQSVYKLITFVRGFFRFLFF